MPARKARHRVARGSRRGGIPAAPPPPAAGRPERLPDRTAGAREYGHVTARRTARRGTRRPAGARHVPRGRSCRHRQPADRADPHHPAMAGRPGQPRQQPLKFAGPASEPGDIPRKRAGRPRSRSDWPRGHRAIGVPGGSSARGSQEPGLLRPGQAQRGRQPTRRLRSRGPADSTLQIAHRPRAHPGRLGQLLLTQSSIDAKPAQQPAKIPAARITITNHPPTPAGPSRTPPRPDRCSDTRRTAPSTRSAAPRLVPQWHPDARIAS